MNAIATKIPPSIFLVCSFQFISFLTVVGQSVTIPADSSRIIFPNHVVVQLRGAMVDNKKHFAMDKLAFKTLLIQTDYLIQQEAQANVMNRFLNKELSVMDSVNKNLQAKIIAEQMRAKNFSDGYDGLRRISTAYDQEMRAVINDLATLKKTNRKNRRKSFVSGMVIGIAVAAVVGVLVVDRD